MHAQQETDTDAVEPLQQSYSSFLDVYLPNKQHSFLLCSNLSSKKNYFCVFVRKPCKENIYANRLDLEKPPTFEGLKLTADVFFFCKFICFVTVRCFPQQIEVVCDIEQFSAYMFKREMTN